MQGRWQMMVRPDGSAPGAAKAPDEGALRHGWSCVPVLPCDDAAIERAGRALAARAGDGEAYDRGEAWAREWREDAEAALRGAGETG